MTRTTDLAEWYRALMHPEIRATAGPAENEPAALVQAAMDDGRNYFWTGNGGVVCMVGDIIHFGFTRANRGQKAVDSIEECLGQIPGGVRVMAHPPKRRPDVVTVLRMVGFQGKDDLLWRQEQ